MNKPFLTVFTPAYNRAVTLPRLYESLLRQTCFDFEWLIIDDGSSDDTSRLIHSFTGEGKFPVRYVYKENGGKHTAHNLALEEAEGEWFLCVDSDDTLAPDAVEMVTQTPARIIGKDHVTGIVAPGRKADLVLFDAKEKEVVQEFVSRSSNSPFVGAELTGVVKCTICDGKIVYRK